MIKRGLRIEDDSDTETPYEKISTDANRHRSKFEKDMDDFLFGGKPSQRPVRSKQTKVEQKITTAVSSQHKEITISKNVTISQSSPVKGVIQQQSKATKLSDSKISRVSKVSEEKPSLAQSQLKKESNKQQQLGVPGDKVMGDKQPSLVFTDNIRSKPSYIRKLRYAAGKFDFSEENMSHHRFIDVNRPIECSRDSVIAKAFYSISANKFKDLEFPPSNFCLGFKLQSYSDATTWKRAEEHFNHVNLGKYIDPNDIKKGVFSSNKFLSTLAVLAEKEENIKRLIEEQSISSTNGSLFYVRLFINSVWRYVIVDSYIPICTQKDGQVEKNGGAVSYPDVESDLWVGLIEKAYAKYFDGYDVFTRPQAREYYLRDLTGAPTSNFMSDNPEILSLVKKALEQKKIVAAIPKSNLSELGMSPNYTLAVMGCNKKGGISLRYCFPLIEDRPSIPLSKEGVFEFSESQLKEYISYISICHVNRSYHTLTIQTKHEREFHTCHSFTIKDQTHGFLSLSQMDERMFPRENYEYNPSRLFIQKKTAEGWEYVTGGFSHMSRNLDVEVNLQPGQYLIFAYITWKYHVYDFYLTGYTDKKIGSGFNKVSTTAGNNHNNVACTGLQAFNSKYGKRSALGHCEQYIIYHQETNQVLTTIVNTSAKPYKYTHDYRKLNFQTLHLVNAVSNESGVLEGLKKEELEDYKDEAATHRQWSLELGPKEAFTWVISTSEEYDPAHYKTWGFK